MIEKTISLTRKQVQAVLNGATQVRFLKKEEEVLAFLFEVPIVITQKTFEQFNRGTLGEFIGNKAKFWGGKVYPVVVDEEPVLYCPKCKTRVINPNRTSDQINFICDCQHKRFIFSTSFPAKFGKMIVETGWKTLRIKVLSIKEQKLMDITNAEAEAEVGEGLKYPRQVLFQDFWECYKDEIPKEILFKIYGTKKPVSMAKYNLDILEEWNPSVWALEFEKVIE